MIVNDTQCQNNLGKFTVFIKFNLKPENESSILVNINQIKLQKKREKRKNETLNDMLKLYRIQTSTFDCICIKSFKEKVHDSAIISRQPQYEEYITLNPLKAIS